jgi:hypothetical protein
LKLWNLCIVMCADWWKPHLVVEHDTLSPSSMTFREKLMFTFWKQKERCLTNSKHTRPWWKMKLAWRSNLAIWQQRRVCVQKIWQLFVWMWNPTTNKCSLYTTTKYNCKMNQHDHCEVR